MRTLYSGLKIPTTINTEERVFKIETFDNETLLCNTKTAKECLEKGEIKNLWHLWDFKFKRFGKKDLKQM
jgi:hypothetical protein